MNMLRSNMMLLSLSVTLLGCSNDDTVELDAWMRQVHSQSHAVLPPLPEPTVFMSAMYDAHALDEPCSVNKFDGFHVAMTSLSSRSSHHKRRREPLENYPLDSLHMVGTVQKAGVMHALLQAEKMIHQVMIGNYVGSNGGRVVDIDESAIRLIEVVQTTTGEWMEREARLELRGAYK